MMKNTILLLSFFSLVLLNSYSQNTELKLQLGSGTGILENDISPNGKYIVAAGVRFLKLWDIKSGKELKTYYDGLINSVAFNKKGNLIIGAPRYESKYIIWDVETGTIQKEITVNKKINKIFFTDNDKAIIYISGGNVFKCDFSTNKVIEEYNLEALNIKPLSFSSDNTKIIGSLNDTTLVVYNLLQREEERKFNGHKYMINAAEFSPDDNYVSSCGGLWNWSGGAKGELKLWGLEKNNLVFSVDTMIGPFIDIAFNPKSRRIASLLTDESNYGRDLLIYDFYGNKHLEKKNYENYEVKYTKDGNFLFGKMTNDLDAFYLYDKDGKKVQSFTGLDINHITNAYLLSDKLVINDYNKSALVYDISANAIIPLKGYPGSTNIEISNDNKTFFTCNTHYSLSSLDTLSTYKSGDKRREIIYYSRMFDNNRKIAAVLEDNSFVIIDLISMQVESKFKLSNIAAHKVQFDIDYKNNNLLYGDNKGNIVVIDLQTGVNKEVFKLSESKINYVRYSDDKKLIVAQSDEDVCILKSIPTINVLKKFKAKNNFNNLYGHFASINISNSGLFFAYLSDNNEIKIYDIRNQTIISKFKVKEKVYNINFSYNDKQIITSSHDKIISVWDVSKGTELLKFVTLKENDWVAVTPNGYFDGTKLGMEEIFHYVKGLNVIPLENMLDKFYTPNLVARVLSDEKFESDNISDAKLPPLVKISSPLTSNKIETQQLSINVKVIDQGGGIDEILIYHNGKLIETTNRGFKPIEQKNDLKTKSFTIKLTNGENIIRATAFNNQRTESISDEVTVFYEGKSKTSDLYMLVIGINDYKNPRYKLNYAVSDATGFKEEIERSSQNIFDNIHVSYIIDKHASRDNIMSEFSKLKEKTKQEDVLIFYYAGHGVMSEEKKSQFYIVPYDVTQLYGNNEMLNAKAISASELQKFSAELKAQKQMFVFDACQSGGMTELLASRGAAEEKAIAQLARSTGTYWLAASNSEQFATEFEALGHGIFTYSILVGLKGQADGGSLDKKITVKELSAFLNDKVPEMAEKYKGSVQYPTSYGYGQDFPIIIVK